MSRIILIFAAAAALSGTTAWADPGHGHGRGHDKHGYAGDGPPGLAKKPYGLPPGQAKKMWRHGDYIPRAYYSETRYYVSRPERYRLAPPPPGYRWVLVEDDAYLVRRDNGLVAEIVANALVNLIR